MRNAPPVMSTDPIKIESAYPEAVIKAFNGRPRIMKMNFDVIYGDCATNSEIWYALMNTGISI